MRKALIAAVLAALLAPALLAAPPGAAGTGAEAAGRAKVIELGRGGNVFTPARTRVRRGRLVKFRWVRGFHNVTKVRGPGRNFRSETTRERGVNFRKRFRRAGRYRIVCTIHDGMELRLRVRRPR